MKTLVILSSILGERSNSEQLADHPSLRLRQAEPGGSIKDKQVLVLSARGGKAEGTPADTLTPYLTQILGFVGPVDPVFIAAEGMALGELAAQEGLALARQCIDALLAGEPRQLAA